MNLCHEFIITLAETVSCQKGNYISVRKSLPLLYERIGKKQTDLMIAAGVIANIHPRMQKSVVIWSLNQIAGSNKNLNNIYWPNINKNILYDFAKEVIRDERRNLS